MRLFEMRSLLKICIPSGISKCQPVSNEFNNGFIGVSLKKLDFLTQNCQQKITTQKSIELETVCKSKLLNPLALDSKVWNPNFENSKSFEK